MADVWQLLLIFSAIAIGWLLGRGWRLGGKRQDVPIHPQYYKGLNYLINDQPDGALDTFVESLEVNSDTLETHIAVGNLMRRKGEVDRAIRIHQNLLSRPSLPQIHLHQAHLELARDFISAGLFDRAERLLKDLLTEAPELKSVALGQLMEIYQEEKEWQQAIDAAQQLLPRRSLLKSSSPVEKVVTVNLSHYCCELAELAMAKNDYLTARTKLKQALSYDRNCIRASLLAASVEFKTGHYSRSIKHLRKVREQDLVFIPETLTLLQSCFQALDDKDGFKDYLVETHEYYSSTSVLLALVAQIKADRGKAAAAVYLSAELKKRQSLKGLAMLIDLHLSDSSGREREDLSILQMLIDQLLQNKPGYQCHQCGFAGRSLHWLCPSCKQWGQIKLIRGVEGD